MTRINLVPAEELTTKHLVSEYRELPRVRHAYPRKIPAKIPNSYRIGKGHVTFFYNKGLWLEKRHSELVDEMLRRGYTVNVPKLDLSHWDKRFMNDWTPTEEEINISKARINERLEEMEKKDD